MCCSRHDVHDIAQAKIANLEVNSNESEYDVEMARDIHENKQDRHSCPGFFL